MRHTAFLQEISQDALSVASFVRNLLKDVFGSADDVVLKIRGHLGEVG